MIDSSAFQGKKAAYYLAQIVHFNSQATTILLTSLSREEYNKVQGFKSAKEIWDVLKTAHEGDEVTKITKRETIEGELGRFRLHQGEEPQEMYNRLKTLVNQVRNLGSKNSKSVPRNYNSAKSEFKC